MYNTDFPTRAELPTAARLKRSTFIAAACAGVLLATVVLPSEYGIDPTGLGGMVGLAEMGRIKMQLASEAAGDKVAVAQAAPAVPVSPSSVQLDRIEARLEQVERLLNDPIRLASSTMASIPEATVTTAGADPVVEQSAETANARVAAAVAPEEKNDEITLLLKPGEGKEVKLVMVGGAEARYSWSASGSVVNFDTHGEGAGRTISYDKGRGVAGDEGVLKAEFDGTHGWFWRNRTSEPVTLTLRTNGAYTEMKRPAL